MEETEPVDPDGTAIEERDPALYFEEPAAAFVRARLRPDDAPAFPDRAFDVVTMLEVLEHLPHPGRALDEVCRLARRFLILSVPAKADDNPEHLHLFDARTLTEMLLARGVERVQLDPVLNHRIAIAKIDAG